MTIQMERSATVAHGVLSKSVATRCSLSGRISSRNACRRSNCMLPQAIAEPLTPTRDARGFVVEPLSLEQLTAQQNVHVVWTAAGAVRGNHHHVRGTEVALVLGPALVRYRDANGIQDVEITKGTLYRFTFPPKVTHAFGALGPEPMFLV